MNALTGGGPCQGQTIATLDTRTRRWSIPDWGTVLLSDTVDYSRSSSQSCRPNPHLKKRQADLLIHVADASSPSVFQQIHSVYLVLKELGSKPRHALVLNKVDAIYGSHPTNRILERYPHAIPVSARTQEGFENSSIEWGRL